ncbi:MAG: ABC transporter permease [Phycisphaerales bacterium]|nr:ABC transporter permease [Phycisphaerales bacterium]
MTDFQIVVRSLTARRFSTVTTIITVAVAVALMLTLLGMKDAARRAFDRGSGNMHLVVSRDASPLVAILNSVFYANPPRAPLSYAQFRQLRDELPVEWAIPTQQGDSFRGLPVTATEPEFFTRLRPDPDREWRFAVGRVFRADFEVVVGAGAARQTGLRVGDQIYVTHGTGTVAALAESAGARVGEGAAIAHIHKEFPFTIVGILEPTGGPHDRVLFVNLHSSWIMHAHDRRLASDPSVKTTGAADVTDADRLITAVLLRLLTRPGQDVTAVEPVVFDQLRRAGGFTVAKPAQEIQRLFAIVGGIHQIFVGMAGVVLLSSGIAIMLALHNSMEQRRRQIAVLRVLGASRGRVFGLMVTESAVIGLLGALAGVGVAVVGQQVVASIMRGQLGLVIEPTVVPAILLGVVAATVALAAVAGLVPGVMAYRTSVLRSLKPLG